MAEFKLHSGEHATGWVITKDPKEIAKYRRLVEDGTGWREIPSEEPDTPEPDGDNKLPALPAKSASNEDWVAAAVARDVDEADAKKATKEQLIELLTAQVGPPAPTE